MARFKIDYDRESDDLFLYSEKKSKGSIEMGNLVLDFDNKGELVGIELFNAVQFLKDAIAKETGAQINKNFLSSLTSCFVSAKQQNNFLFLKIMLISGEIKISCPINTPLIEKTSPGLAYT